MEKKEIEEIIKQVLYNPQVTNPAISYIITDVKIGDKGEDYVSEYIDVGDFNRYVKDLERQLVYRLTTNIK